MPESGPVKSSKPVFLLTYLHMINMCTTYPNTSKMYHGMQSTALYNAAKKKIIQTQSRQHRAMKMLSVRNAYQKEDRISLSKVIAYLEKTQKMGIIVKFLYLLVYHLKVLNPCVERISFRWQNLPADYQWEDDKNL